jgi:hypothetical protein
LPPLSALFLREAGEACWAQRYNNSPNGQTFGWKKFGGKAGKRVLLAIKIASDPIIRRREAIFLKAGGYAEQRVAGQNHEIKISISSRNPVKTIICFCQCAKVKYPVMFLFQIKSPIFATLNINT